MAESSTSYNYQSAVPAWLDQYYQDIAARTKFATEQPYQPYTGPRVAQFTGDQNQAFGLARSQVGQAGGILQNTALPMLNRATTAPTQQGIAQYMDPYNSLVTDSIIRELNRQNDITKMGIADQARAAGAFGGSRHGIVDAEANRNNSQLIADVLARQGQANYGQALGQFNTQQQMNFTGANQAVGIAGAAQQAGTNDVNQLMGIGQQQQALGQQSLNMGYEDFQRQQYLPYEQIGFQSGILRGTPTPGLQPTQVTQNQPSASPLAQGLGLGIAAYGAYNMFK